MRLWGSDSRGLQMLEKASFTVKHISLTPEFLHVADIISTQEAYRGALYAGVSEADIEDCMKEVQEMCSVDCRDSEGNWVVMYSRLRFVAVLQ